MNKSELGIWEGSADGTVAVPEVSPFFRVISRDWPLVVAIAALIALGCIAFSLILPTTYRATTVLFPRPQGGETTRLSASSLLGLGSSTSASTDEALSTLSSDKFVADFINRHGYLRLLYPKQWDAQAQTWKNGQSPDMREAVRDFDDGLKVETKATSQVVTVSYVNRDPKLAADILNRLIGDLNAVMQNEAVSRSRAVVAEYSQELQSPAAKSTDVQQHLGQLITDEMKTLVTARASPDYVFRVVDPAVPPDRKAAPQRAIIVIIGTLCGIFVGFLTIFLRQFLRDIRAGLRREGH